MNQQLRRNIAREAKLIKRNTCGRVRISRRTDFYNLYINGKHTEMMSVGETVGFIRGWQAANGQPLMCIC